MIDLSVCIPSYDRSAHLAALLESLTHDLNRVAEGDEWTAEVVVLLDGSTDGSVGMIKGLVDDYPVDLRWEWQENRGRSAARNRLIDLARGRLLWFLDDDMVVAEGTLDRHLRWNRNTADVMLGPSYVVGPSEGLAMFYEGRWDRLENNRRITEPEDILFSNSTLPTEVLALNRFDESFVGYGFEDYELALRLLKAGVTFGFNAEAQVFHHTNKSGFDSLADIREEGANRVRVTHLHPEAGAFALQLRHGRLASLLRPLAERGVSLPLWLAAHVVRAAALPLSGDRLFRVVRIADDFALYSGLAVGWREFGTPQPNNSD